MAKKMMSSKVARPAATAKVVSKSGEHRLTQSIKGSLNVEGYAVTYRTVAKAVSQRTKK